MILITSIGRAHAYNTTIAYINIFGEDNIKFITGFYFKKKYHSFFEKLLPNSLYKKFLRRFNPEIPDKCVISIISVQFISSFLKLFGIKRRVLFADNYFDIISCLYILIFRPTILHSWKSHSLYSNFFTKKLGITQLVDIGTCYPQYYLDTLSKCYENNNIKITIPGYFEAQKQIKEIKNNKYFLIPSKFAIKTFEQYECNEKEFLLLPYGIDTSKFYFMNKINQGLIKIIFIGNISLNKGFLDIIHVLKRLRKEKVKFEMNIFGSIYDDAQQLFQENIDLFNYHRVVGQTTLNEALNDNDVYLMPSLIEGMSLSVIEAINTKLEVIITENCGIDTKQKNVHTLKRDQHLLQNIFDLIIDANNNLGTIRNNRNKNEIFYRTWKDYEEDLRKIISKIEK
jgi:glycosyltransferase involved in cell wall biosynthesis